MTQIQLIISLYFLNFCTLDELNALPLVGPERAAHIHDMLHGGDMSDIVVWDAKVLRITKKMVRAWSEKFITVLLKIIMVLKFIWILQCRV